MQRWFLMRTGYGRSALIALGVAVLLVAVLWLGYQRRVPAALPIPGLGDQWFVGTTEAQGATATEDGLLYPDERDANGGRFRWTRGRAVLALPGLSAGDERLELRVAGWPDDVLRQDLPQPLVHVLANDTPLGVFTPTSALASYDFPLETTHPLTLELRLGATSALPPITATSFFTATATYPDERRPLGLRLYGASVTSGGLGSAPPGVLMIWAAALGLALGLGLRGRGRLIGAVGLALGLGLIAATARLYVAPLLSVASWLLAGALLWTWRHQLLGFGRGWLARAHEARAINQGAAVAVVAGLALLAGPWVVAFLREQAVQPLSPQRIMVTSFGFSVVSLLFLRWMDLAQILARANVRLQTRRWPGLLILAGLLSVWGLYIAGVMRALPYAGNADYSDNVVVARNLATGRGWIVDYVTQFYHLTPTGSVSRVQETWPLLQPVWIAPFWLLSGGAIWAAKLPNLLFLAALSVLVYHIAVELWDRRVGLAAVVLILINQHYIRLQIYTTSDLGFAFFYIAAAWLAWRGIRSERRGLLVAGGILIGLMCLQKPSGTVVAVGMGLWALVQVWGEAERWRRIGRLALWWVLPALIVFAPYVVRNSIEFGKPVYSTESYDAWVLEYNGGPSQWDDIYSVMTTEGGLNGRGLPDKSWILRWGFQRTYDKIVRQVRETRNYLLPASAGLGPLSGKGALMGNADQGFAATGQWLMVGAWLALAGLIVATKRQRSWLGLIAWSFGPYTLFLILYWHANEERYFVPLVPVLALLAGHATWRLHDAVASAWGGRLRPLAVIAAVALLVLAVQPGWTEARDKLDPRGERADWAADMAAFAWLRDNTPEGSVVMTRVPWQLNLHAERPALMVPNTASLDELLRIAEYYDARYLLVNAISNEKLGARVALDGLLQGQERAGFEQLAAFPGPRNRTLYIYAFPPDYNGVPPIVPAGATER